MKEIKIFDKNEFCCAQEIQKLANLTRVLEKFTFKRKGLSSSQAYTILEIYNSEELKMSELSELLGLDCSTSTRNIKKLIDLGLVNKKNSDIDKRIVLVFLSEKGKLEAKEIKEDFRERFGKVVCGIPKDKFREIFLGISLLLEFLEQGEKEIE